MTTRVSLAAARRMFLHAQGLARSRPNRTVTTDHFRAYLGRQGVVQVDSVNVLARAHYLPIFSRLGPYDRDAWDSFLWRSGDTFEHWGHEASVMPRDLLPALGARMAAPTSWHAGSRERLDAERPGLIDQVHQHLRTHGPSTARDIEHLAPRTSAAGPWWDHSHVKEALEYLFIVGGAAVADRPGFRRLYGDAAQVWGVDPREVALGQADAHQVLFDRALDACHVGTADDIADHFRLPAAAQRQALAHSAVERGLAQWIEVDGWDQPALVHRDAQDPGRSTGRALLSPFDPVCWYRPRLERMFGMHYRIEIYTPAHRRQYGYYCLPFLLGDQMVARVDLKADRAAGTLLVQAAWREEPGRAFGPRKGDSVVAVALAAELALVGRWLDLDDVVVRPVGTLAPALTPALAAVMSAG